MALRSCWHHGVWVSACSLSFHQEPPLELRGSSAEDTPPSAQALDALQVTQYIAHFPPVPILLPQLPPTTDGWPRVHHCAAKSRYLLQVTATGDEQQPEEVGDGAAEFPLPHIAGYTSDEQAASEGVPSDCFVPAAETSHRPRWSGVSSLVTPTGS